MFRKLDQFPSSGARLVTPTRLGLIESLVQRKVYVPPVSHLKTETYQAFETLCFFRISVGVGTMSKNLVFPKFIYIWANKIFVQTA
jgi:hypothetical protein